MSRFSYSDPLPVPVVAWCVGLALISLGPAPAHGQEAAPFRARAEIVRLFVSVIPDRDAPAADLTAADFEVTENGEPRDISVFFGPDDAPLEVAVVADMSGSMHRWQSDHLVNRLLDQLHPETCVLLVPYREEVLAARWGSAADPELREFISRFELVDNEATLDAVVAAYQLLRERRTGTADSGLLSNLMRFRAPPEELLPPPPTTSGQCEFERSPAAVRRAVVVVTDEPVARSRATLADVMLYAWGSGIPFFAVARIQEPSEGSVELRGRPANDTTFRLIESLAEHTGGLTLRYHAYSSSFEEQLQRIGQALRHMYLLGFTPAPASPDGTESVYSRHVAVSTMREGFNVLLTEEVVLGAGRSEGAALDLALTGFGQLAAGALEPASLSFELAVGLAPGLPLGHYGLGLVAVAAERFELAHASLSRARDLAPWLPDIDAYLGTVELRLGRIEEAWKRTVQAYHAGGQVAHLIDELQRVAPREIDLSAPPPDPLVAIRVDGVGPLRMRLAAPAILRAVFQLVDDAPGMRATWHQDAANLLLTVRGSEETRRGARDGLRGWLTLEDRDGKRHASEAFDIRDSDDPESMAAALSRAFGRIEARVQEMNRTRGPS